MTANQLRQVFRTYTTQPLSWFILLPGLLMHATLLLWVSEEELGDVTWMTLVANLNLGMMTGFMLNIQFANPRARLLPGFRTAHLVGAGAIVGAALAMEAGLVLSEVEVAGTLALVSLNLVAIVASGWIAYLMSPVGIFLFAPLMFGVMFGSEYVAALTQALVDRPAVSVGIACAGLAAMAALGVRIWMISEEMPEYSRQIPIRWDFTSRAGNRNWRRWEARVIARAGNQGRLFDLLFGLVLRGGAAMGWLRRLLFRQLAGGFSGLSMIPGVVAVTLIVFGLQTWLYPPMEPGEVFFLSFFPLHLVLSMMAGLWLRRWPHLAGESLWPLERRDFVGDLARSMACDMAGGAVAHGAMIIVWLRLFPPQGPLPGLLLPWLGLTMVQYVVAYCLMFWLVSFRRFSVLIFGTLGVNVILAALVTAALFVDGGFWSPVSVAGAIVVTVAVMALFYRLGFMRWCRVDLD